MHADTVSQERKRIVIIGGVACGMKAACRLRRRDPLADITVIEKGAFLSYGACGFPFYICGMVPDYKNLMDTPIGAVRDEAFFKNVKGVTALTRTAATRIDRHAKTVEVVHLETGKKENLSYDKLVLATGAVPFVPPLEGRDLRGVFSLWTMTEARAVKEFLSNTMVSQAAIVGGGLIGLEMAEALSKLGIQVSVIEKLEHIVPALLDKEYALLLTRYLESKGINIYTSDAVRKFSGSDTKMLTSLITEREEIPAQLALLSIGVRPDVTLAREAGLEIGQTGALKVTPNLQTSDPDIYAGGDCVENVHRLTRKAVYAPMGSTANKHGRVIADCIAGDDETFPGVLGTAIFKVFDYSVGRTGLSEQEAVKLGHEVMCAIVPAPDKPHFYEGARPIIIKLIAEKATGKLLGAQMVGPGDVAKRLEIAVTSLSHGGTVEELSKLDLAYAPPFAPAMDNIVTAANVLRNKLYGKSRGCSPLEVKEKLDHGDDFIFLDVRSPQEYEQMRIDHPAVKLMPLGKVRSEGQSLPMNKEIIVSCKSSLRAYEAQLMLQAQGFTNVRFMDGGILAWPFELKTGS